MSFWRKEEPELNSLGALVKGGMWEHQRRWWDSESFIKALVTGYGGGKTLIGSKRAISVCLLNAPSPYVTVSPSYKIARRTVIPTIKALLDGKMTLDRNLSYKYNKSDFEFTIRYGNRVGTIWCTSGDDPDSLKGPNIGAALIDEPFIQDRAVFEQILARVRDPIAKHREIGLTGTPEDLNWGYDICEGEEKDKFDLELIQGSTQANRALPADYVERLRRGFSEKAVQAYLEGKFVSLTEGLVYYAFDDDNIVELPDPGHELIVGMDFNVDPMSAVVGWVNGNHVHIIDEIELPNADTQQMCSLLHEKYPGRIQDVYPDASGRSRKTSSLGKTDFYYIKEAGFNTVCRNVNPPIRDRYNAVNGKFRNAQGSPTLTISPKCRKLKTYLKQYSHRQLNKQQHMSHLLDAMGYPIAYLFPIKPISSVVTVTGA